MEISEEVTTWLSGADPSVVWQAQRDLFALPESTWKRTRRRVASEGWGERLLSHRASDGTWGGGLYSPKWISTFYSLRLLTHLGLEPTQPEGCGSCELLLDEGVTEGGGVSLWNAGYTDTCVTAMLLSMACHFGFSGDERVGRMVRWLLAEQMTDGGWNCEREKGAVHASFHTTISALEGLAAHLAATGPDEPTQVAMKKAHDFFLRHQLYRSCTTGEVVKDSFTRFSFPPRWFFDVLRGLEHFAHVDAPWDDRLADPVDLLLRRRDTAGRWSAQNKHTGRTYFDLDRPRAPSPMNTLRALRVLRWVERVRG